MSKRVTLKDVAARAGVSTATVSFAFSKPDRVREATLQAVLQAAANLNYIPSAAARGLARGRTGAIGLLAYDYRIDIGDDVLTADADWPDGRLFPLYSDEVQRGVRLECRRRGLALVLGGGQPRSHLAQVVDLAGRVDGLITLPGTASDAALDYVIGRVPLVALGDPDPKYVARIPVANEFGMRRMAEHLLHTHGYKRLAYLGATNLAEFRDRFQGFHAVITAAGLRPGAVRDVIPRDPRTSRAAIAELVDRRQLPEVVVCDTDQGALAVMEFLESIGVKVPEMIAVVGFDGLLAGRLATPRLTTVEQPMGLIGHEAVALLCDLLDGRPTAVNRDPLPTRLSVGASCGCEEDGTLTR